MAHYKVLPALGFIALGQPFGLTASTALYISTLPGIAQTGAHATSLCTRGDVFPCPSSHHCSPQAPQFPKGGSTVILSLFSSTGASRPIPLLRSAPTRTSVAPLLLRPGLARSHGSAPMSPLERCPIPWTATLPPTPPQTQSPDPYRTHVASQAPHMVSLAPRAQLRRLGPRTVPSVS